MYIGIHNLPRSGVKTLEQIPMEIREELFSASIKMEGFPIRVRVPGYLDYYHKEHERLLDDKDEGDVDFELRLEKYAHHTDGKTIEIAIEIWTTGRDTMKLQLLLTKINSEFHWMRNINLTRGEITAHSMDTAVYAMTVKGQVFIAMEHIIDVFLYSLSPGTAVRQDATTYEWDL